MMTLLAPVVVALALATQTDTTLAVKPGIRLEVENFGGEIAVSTWNRNAVRIKAEHSRRTRVEIESCESCIIVRSAAHRGPPSAVNYRITAPRWMNLKLSGVYTDVAVEGTLGEVSAETVKGEVSLKGGKGSVALQSVEGMVSIVGARAAVRAMSVNEDVRIVDVQGPVVVETVNGDIAIEDIVSGIVEGTTVNGDIDYRGALHDGARYRFATHNGDVVLALPRPPQAAFSIETFRGAFESSFPVKLASRPRPGKRFDFILGSGSAEVALESFQGTIRLIKLGEAARKRTPRAVGKAPKPTPAPDVEQEEED